MKTRRILVGIDPGTGSRSGLGFAAVDGDTGRILALHTLWTSKDTKKAQAWVRIRELASVLKEGLTMIEPNLEEIFIESFVMQGKSGETLARMVGAVIGTIPERTRFTEVANTRVKKLVGGKGDMDKLQVAQGLLKIYSADADLIQAHINSSDWDSLDALAIIAAGVKQNGG